MPRLFECIRAAAFDLDGTLVDSSPDIVRAANEMLGAIGCARLAEPRIAALIGHGIDRLVQGAIIQSTGRIPTAEKVETARGAFRRFYGERLFERSRVYPGVTEGLHALQQTGTRLCCVTNKDAAFAEPLLDAAGLTEFFDFTLCPETAAHRKPRPDMLIDAGARFQVATRELLFVGDSSIDVEAARAAGCPVAAVDYGYNQGRSIAASRPDWIIGSLADLPNLPARRTHQGIEN